MPRPGGKPISFTSERAGQSQSAAFPEFPEEPSIAVRKAGKGARDVQAAPLHASYGKPTGEPR
jgi:hypothetical protein